MKLKPLAGQHTEFQPFLAHSKSTYLCQLVKVDCCLILGFCLSNLLDSKILGLFEFSYLFCAYVILGFR